MSKRPSFQFYPGDWLNDAALRMVSVPARGLWIDMLCLMHQGSEYGYLKVNHKAILPSNLARIVGATISEVEGWLEELENAGVFSRCETGSIFSRRMIRDEEIRKARADGGKLGGNPELKGKNKVNLQDNLPPTPSSSSSSSSSSSVKTLRPVVADIYPQIADRQLVEDWLKVRKAKKAPVTETALAGFLHEVEKSGLSLEDALRKCCEHSWAGFKASWIHKQEVKKLDEITPELFDWAVNQGVPEGRIKSETDKFILSCKAKGDEFVDWVAAWKSRMITVAGYVEQRR